MTESRCFSGEMSSFKIMLQKVGFGSDRTNIPEEHKEDNGSTGELLAEKKRTPENCESPSKSDTDSLVDGNLASDEEIVTVYTVPPPSVQQESKRSAPARHSGDSSAGIEFRERKKKRRKKVKKKVPMETPPPEINRRLTRNSVSFAAPLITPGSIEEDTTTSSSNNNSNNADSELLEEDEAVDAADIVGDTTPFQSPQKNKTSPQRATRSAATKATASAKAKPRQPPVKAGIRVKSRRSQLYHCLNADLQKYLPQEHPNYQNYYGTVVKKSRGRKAAYDIKFDVFRGDEVAEGLRREIFTTVKKGEEEPPLDPKYLAKIALEDELTEELVKDEEEIRCEKDFIKQDVATLKEAKSFTHHFHKKKPPIVWEIVPADDDIADCERFNELKEHMEDGAVINKDIDFQGLSNSELFMERFLPNVAGLAKRMDQYYEDPRARYHVTVKDRKIKIHDEDDDDPDWKIKQWLLLTIRGAAVHGIGIESFWRSGMLEGDIEAADFGQFMDVVEYKVIGDALPFMWSDSNLWYRDSRDVPWDAFMPFIEEWNQKQQALFEDYHLVVTDETMFAWVPKTSKLGGLPNYTFEPRKPKPLGTMARDTSECTTGVVIHTDPVMNPSIQDKKQFATKKSNSPEHIGGNVCHAPHVAETLRQAYHSNLQQGDWITGDAWFGSVQSAIALKNQVVTRLVVTEDGDRERVREPLGVDSSFVVKNNCSLYPRGPLRAVLQARHPKRMAGHWVVFKSTIQDVEIKAIAYAWSNREIMFIVTTVGNTTEALNPYVSFDGCTGFDGGDTKLAARPDIAEFFTGFLPHIDTYNRLRQYSISIENQWPTKCCWRKLLMCYLGQSVVNQTKILAYAYPSVPGKDMKVRDMCASVSAGLRRRDRRVLPLGLQEKNQQQFQPLGRVGDCTGNTKKQLTKAQQEKRRASGSSRQRACFVCRKYKEKYQMATGLCQRCGTCLCLPKQYPGRPLTCQEEHMTSTDPAIRCNGVKKGSFPKASRAPNFVLDNRTRHGPS